MRILFINTVDLDTNGISTFIINNAKYLAKGNNVSIAYSNNLDDKLAKKLHGYGINLIKLPSRKQKLIFYYKELVSTIRKYKFDVVHVNGNSTTMALELMAAKHANCHVRIGHAHNTKTAHPIFNILLRPVFNYYITQRFACSQEAGRWLFNNKKYLVIKNGVALDKYFPNGKSRELIRTKLKLSPEDILLINVGGFNAQKNQRFLIKVMGLLPTKFKLLLIGDGALQGEIKSEVLNRGLEKRVFFTGSVSNVPVYLSASDIFVMPSKFEGFPYALVEAQASGLTCFVSDKITKKVDLTGNVNFISIKNASTWQNVILHSNYISFNERINNSSSVEEEISSKGFSMEKNSENLYHIYTKDISM